MNFYLGCAVWSYKDWVGNLYPPKSKSSDFLKLYSRRFTTVEGNATFYAIPAVETIAKWATQTPGGFKFCPKLNRNITHQGLLAPMIPDALDFLERMSGLGDRLGTTFIQLPPNYSPEYLADLVEFLTACSQFGVSLALEVRHLDWFQERYAGGLNSLLTKLNIARTLLDTRPIYHCPDDPQVNSQRKKPNVPLDLPLGEPAPGNIGFVRFISHPDPQYNQIYLEQWVNQIVNWINHAKTVYFFVHCPQEVRSPDTAKYFYTLLKSRLNVSELPWNNFDPQPTQLRLF